MKAKHMATIIVAIIGAVGTIGGSYCSAKWGQSNFAITVNTTGGGDIEVNKENIETIVSESEELKAKNSDYESKIDELESKNKELMEKIDNASEDSEDVPAIEFQDIGLSIDGEKQIMDESESCVMIDGEKYFSKVFLDSIVGEDKSIEEENGVLYIGKIIADQELLSDQDIVGNTNSHILDMVTDSYGNDYANAFVFPNAEYGTIFNLGKRFSMLKAKVAITRQASQSAKGCLEILADETSVYKSDILTFKTQVFDIDIPINNANNIEIKYTSNSSGCKCILSDAIVYNQRF